VDGLRMELENWKKVSTTGQEEDRKREKKEIMCTRVEKGTN